jgi:hypothetical protein
MKKKSLLFWLNIFLLFVSWLMAITDFGSLAVSNYDFETGSLFPVNISPFVFFLMPAVQSAIVLLIMMLVRYPQLYNFPRKDEVRLWPDKYREPVYKFLASSILLVATFLNVMFILIQNLIVGHEDAVAIKGSRAWLLIGMIFIWLPFSFYYLGKINRVIKCQRRKLGFSQSKQIGN